MSTCTVDLVDYNLGINFQLLCTEMSSKLQFQLFFSDYNVMYGPNGVDLQHLSAQHVA